MNAVASAVSLVRACTYIIKLQFYCIDVEGELNAFLIHVNHLSE